MDEVPDRLFRRIGSKDRPSVQQLGALLLNERDKKALSDLH
jgi:hypothetical protein